MIPSKRDVLNILFYNKHTVKVALQDSASLMFNGCQIFWTKPRISNAYLGLN